MPWFWRYEGHEAEPWIQSRVSRGKTIKGDKERIAHDLIEQAIENEADLVEYLNKNFRLEITLDKVKIRRLRFTVEPYFRIKVKKLDQEFRKEP